MGSPTRSTGTLLQWNDARGFGFVEDSDGGRRSFVHISAYPADGPRPGEGDELEYTVGPGSDGRRQALDVKVRRSARIVRHEAERYERRGRIQTLPLMVVPLFLVLFGLVIARWEVPLWGIVIYPAMSVATFLLYLADKRAALAGTWRVRETTLLVAGLLGGWPGGVVAQQVLRHKNRKREFQAAFWCLAVLNVAIFVLAVWHRGPIADILQQL